MRIKPRNELARVVKTLRSQVVKNRKGKGSYSRKGKKQNAYKDS